MKNGDDDVVEMRMWLVQGRKITRIQRPSQTGQTTLFGSVNVDLVGIGNDYDVASWREDLIERMEMLTGYHGDAASLESPRHIVFSPHLRRLRYLA
jgi:hypothetical protein